MPGPRVPLLPDIVCPGLNESSWATVRKSPPVGTPTNASTEDLSERTRDNTNFSNADFAGQPISGSFSSLRGSFLVESGETKRIVVQSGQSHVDICVQFRLDYEDSLIDAKLARKLKLVFIPLPPNKREPRKSLQGLIRPRKFVMLKVTDMEPIPLKPRIKATQLSIAVFQSHDPFRKIILGRAAARKLGLKTIGGQANQVENEIGHPNNGSALQDLSAKYSPSLSQAEGGGINVPVAEEEKDKRNEDNGLGVLLAKTL